MKRLLPILFCIAVALTVPLNANAQIKAKDLGKSTQKAPKPATKVEAQAKQAPQEEPSGNGMKDVPFRERIYFGGNAGLSLGTITYISVSPIVGYLITPRLSAGPGITYRYLSDSRTGQRTNIYGYRAFARYSITETIFAYSEFENLAVPSLRNDNRTWLNTIFAGVGYYQPLTSDGRIGVQAMALYNFGKTGPGLLYTSPFVFRIGFVGGGILSFL